MAKRVHHRKNYPDPTTIIIAVLLTIFIKIILKNLITII